LVICLEAECRERTKRAQKKKGDVGNADTPPESSKEVVDSQKGKRGRYRGERVSLWKRTNRNIARGPQKETQKFKPTPLSIPSSARKGQNRNRVAEVKNKPRGAENIRRTKHPPVLFRHFEQQSGNRKKGPR